MEQNVTYNGAVKLIFDQNCAIPFCHVQGGFGKGDFTTYSGIRPKVDNGSLRDRLFYRRDMPLGPPLAPCDLQTMKVWLDKNAPE